MVLAAAADITTTQGARLAGDVMAQEKPENPAPNGTHYQIIKDLDEVNNFVHWLPELVDNECYYIELFSRKKYDRSIPNSKTCNLVRHIATSKDGIIRALRRMEVPVGTFHIRETVCTQQSLAAYISTSPRCRKKATYSLMKTLLDKITKDEEIYPHSAALTAIHRCRSRACFVTFDIDPEEVNEKEWMDIFVDIRELVGEEAFSAIRTRGGYHMLIEPTKVVTALKDWHRVITTMLQCDQTGDILSPIPGCVQGGFVPKLAVQNGKIR